MTNIGSNFAWKAITVGLLLVIVLAMMVIIPILDSLIQRMEVAEGAQLQAEKELQVLRSMIDNDTMERRLQKLESYYQQEEQERW